MINNKIDLHIHSTKSVCGYSTISEIFNDAKKKEMELIGITDHDPYEKKF